MKTKFQLLSLFLIIVISSCKKNLITKSVSTASKQEMHGLGAIINDSAYQKLPKANFVNIKADLIKMGYGNRLSSNSLAIQSLPSSIILTHPAIGDQGQTGTCVSWSLGYALRATLNNEFNNGVSPNPRSEWFIYQMDHSSRNDNSTTDGMITSNGLTILQNNGVSAESLDANLGNPATTPSSTVQIDGAKDKISSFSTASTISDIKTALSMNLPVEMAFNDYTSFDAAFENGTIYTTFGGTLRGGHAVCIIGYDDSKNAVLVQNSWGVDGGDPSNPGCVWIDYGLFTNSQLDIQLYVATPPPVININGASSYTWYKTSQTAVNGQGTISAPPGTLVQVSVDSYGPTPMATGTFRVTNFQIQGATLTSPMGSSIYVSNTSVTGSFTMPSSGSVTWSGYFEDTGTPTGGYGSIGVN